MRLLRAAVVSVVAAAAVLRAPGVAAADSVYVDRDCDQFWFWWIPFPCDRHRRPGPVRRIRRMSRHLSRCRMRGRPEAVENCRWPLLPCGRLTEEKSHADRLRHLHRPRHGLHRLRRHRPAGRPAGLAERRPGGGPDDRPARPAAPATAATVAELAAEDVVVPPPGVVVEFDDVERRAVRALAESASCRRCGTGAAPAGRGPGRRPADGLSASRTDGPFRSHSPYGRADLRGRRSDATLVTRCLTSLRFVTATSRS